MNIYFFIFLIAAIVIMMACMTHGFNDGFARELETWLSLLAAIFCIRILTGIVTSFQSSELSGLLRGIVILIIFAGVYKIFKILFGTINIIAELPIIRIADRVLGMFMGMLTGFTILYVIEYLLRNYILA